MNVFFSVCLPIAVSFYRVPLSPPPVFPNDLSSVLIKSCSFFFFSLCVLFSLPGFPLAWIYAMSCYVKRDSRGEYIIPDPRL